MNPDPNTDIGLSREGGEPDCEACAGSNCDPEYLYLRRAGNFSAVFGCPAPQELWEVKITQEIGTSYGFLFSDKNLYLNFWRKKEVIQ